MAWRVYANDEAGSRRRNSIMARLRSVMVKLVLWRPNASSNSVSASSNCLWRSSVHSSSYIPAPDCGAHALSRSCWHCAHRRRLPHDSGLSLLHIRHCARGGWQCCAACRFDMVIAVDGTMNFVCLLQGGLTACRLSAKAPCQSADTKLHGHCRCGRS